MISEPFRPRLPYLRIELLGSLDDRMSLSLRAEDSAASTRWHAERKTSTSRTADLKVPGPVVRLVARDENSAAAFAFREPREVGRWSHFAERLLASAGYVLAGGIALACGATLSSFFGRSETERK
jgi:hypothetical protein